MGKRSRQLKAERARQPAMALNSPAIPDGLNGGGWLYDAVNSSSSRIARPFFATDSSVTLNSWSRLRAMSLARWAYVNVPFFRGPVDLMASLSMGIGFVPQSLTKDKGWNAAADALVMDRFSHIGYFNGENMDQLNVFDSRLMDVDGDTGYVMTIDEFGAEKLQLIEGHRIKSGDKTSPNLFDGVWFDSTRRKTGYEVALPGEQGTRTIAAKDFIYIAENNRPDEARSITNLIHALVPLQDLYEIFAFQQATVKKNSEIGLVIQAGDPTAPIPGLGPIVPTRKAEARDATNGQPAVPEQRVTYEQVYGGGGKIPILRNGQTLASFKSEAPIAGIDMWSDLTIRGIGAGYRLPIEIFWDPSKLGGANIRLVMGLANKRFEERRAAVRRDKLSRCRFWIVARAIKRGELPWRDDCARVAWRPNFRDPTIDAGRDSKERRANVQSGLDTFTSYFADDGESYEAQLAVRQSEIEKQCEAAAALCLKFPQMSFEVALARIAGTITPGGSELSNPANQPKANEET